MSRWIERDARASLPLLELDKTGALEVVLVEAPDFLDLGQPYGGAHAEPSPVGA